MPDAVISADMTEEQVERYMFAYHATVNMLANAVVTLDRLARTHPDPARRPGFRAAALDANRMFLLVQAEMLAFIRGTSILRPPNTAEVAQAQALVADLAVLIAADARAKAVLDFLIKATETFDDFTK